ncbi:MAG: Mth938-like domain-containing protein [Xanthomonadaceae bacterium]|jgi:uncharacterized protein|nr:Mth938-like domain-containing protein [Xanthomonadaceae bacterium]
MQLTHELPDYRYILRFADGHSARVNDRVLTSSFILSPDTLIESWSGTDVPSLTNAQLEPLLALSPELVLLGTGETQIFPAPATMVMFMSRGIGVEIMNNAAAARTYNVLASEGRRVAAGFLLQP